MKFLVTMKSPDAVDMCAQQAVEDGADPEEVKAAIDAVFKYGEMLTVEVCTETKTARVV